MLKIMEEEFEKNENFHCVLEENHDILLRIFCWKDSYFPVGELGAQNPHVYQLYCLLNFSTLLVQITV